VMHVTLIQDFTINKDIMYSTVTTSGPLSGSTAIYSESLRPGLHVAKESNAVHGIPHVPYACCFHS
jgi:hypothetical protein